jgi:hypothetical protein
MLCWHRMCSLKLMLADSITSRSMLQSQTQAMIHLRYYIPIWIFDATTPHTEAPPSFRSYQTRLCNLSLTKPIWIFHQCLDRLNHMCLVNYLQMKHLSFMSSSIASCSLRCISNKSSDHNTYVYILYMIGI